MGGYENPLPGQGCVKAYATRGPSRAWEDHAQEIHVKGTTLNSGLCGSRALDIAESSQRQLVSSPWSFR